MKVLRLYQSHTLLQSLKTDLTQPQQPRNCSCQSSKPLKKQLNVLCEEKLATSLINTSLTSTRTPSHASSDPSTSFSTTTAASAPSAEQESNSAQKRKSSTIMLIQSDMLNAGSNDDEDDEQLGSVQRTFRRFNFRDSAHNYQSSQPNNENFMYANASSRPIAIQTSSRPEYSLKTFMCGSTPIISSGVPSPSIAASFTDTSSVFSSNNSNMSVCHYQTQAQNQCGCKAAARQNTTSYAPLNPHHDAQHAQNHMCNDAENCRWLILMNPINALHISVTLGAKGRIFRTDDALAAILGYDCTNRLFGTEIHRLIPELRIDLEINSRPQQCCGCSIKRNGVPFTATVVVELDKDQNPMAFNVQLRSLAFINGVVTITDAGLMYSYNENFLHELIGRDLGKTDEVMLITDIIPNFYMSSTIASLNADQATATSECISDSEMGLPHVKESEESLASVHSRHKTEGRSSSVPTIQVGAFYGLAKHVNGVFIPIRFDVSRLDMQSTPRLYAVGIGYERGIDYGISQDHSEENFDMTVNSTATRHSSSSDDSDVELRLMKLKGAINSDNECEDGAGGLQMNIRNIKLSALADQSNEVICGEYSTFYDTFQLIGNGTFGSVKLAARKDTGLLAVTKFVCKDKVLPESWVRSSTRLNRMIPIEVHLLETLNHQNIVKVLDVFENQKYYQLVMEKLGCGMDLFEFVESHPIMDEELTSYLFRQIVSAVEYLASSGIVHRDIKDENVIIDSNFCCKLIDFGSAAYFGPDIVFSTFCGTMEYCSPEVLTGNKYMGPEVEMWSLGILLYTLVFFTNPFRTPQETVHADFEIPHKISEGLYQVLSWLLRADPRYRATVHDIINHWWVTQPVDPSKYKFREVVRNSERARVSPPLYVSDLQNHLKNASSCGNLANSSINNLDSAPTSESGVVSAR